MPYRRSLVPIAHRLAAWPALAIFAALCGNGHALADPLSRDPVTDFRQALVQEKDTVKDKEALRYRRETLTRKAQAIATPGEMSRVLLLQEWRVEGIGGDLIADIDREILCVGAGVAQGENRLFRRPCGPPINLEPAWIAAHPVRIR